MIAGAAMAFSSVSVVSNALLLRRWRPTVPGVEEAPRPVQGKRVRAMSVTIGEAASRSGVPAKTIRYYEQIGLIGAAQRGTNQYRSYTAADVEMLRFIGRARRLGFSVH